MLKILLIFIFSINSFHAVGNDIFNELEMIKKANEEKPIKVQDNRARKELNRLEIFKVKVNLAEVKRSKLEPVFIPKNSELIKIETNEAFYTTQDINAKAYIQPDHQSYRYVTDKNKKIRYKVLISELSDVREVTKLYEPPQPFKRLKKKIKKQKYDKKFHYFLSAKLQSGLTTTSSISNFIKNSNSIAPLLRAEVFALTDFNLAIQTGLTFQYETIRGSNFTTQTLSLGPDFKFRDLIGSYDFHLQTRISLLSNLQGSSKDLEQSLSLSETALVLGLEKDYKYFTFGLNIQRKWITPNVDKSIISFSLDGETDNSFALYISRGVNL